MHKFKGRGVVRKPGQMNGWETQYSKHLEALKFNGAILWYAFEPVKFRLANRTSYSPDFMVIRKDLTVEFHEVKGHWEDHARVKIKVAAEMYPFVFRAITKNKHGWVYEEFTKEEINTNVT